MLPSGRSDREGQSPDKPGFFWKPGLREPVPPTAGFSGPAADDETLRSAFSDFTMTRGLAQPARRAMEVIETSG
jgi:hypothetical protein